jgi:hypothetical protein
MLGPSRDDFRSIIYGMVVDDEYLHVACRIALRNQGTEASRDVLVFIAHRENDGDLRAAPDECRATTKRVEQSTLSDGASDQPADDRQPSQRDG